MQAALVVRDVAAVKKVKSGQIALAWLLHKGQDFVPIPGAKWRTHLEENPDAVQIQLDAAQMQQLDAALAPGKISGKRYNETILATINR